MFIIYITFFNIDLWKEVDKAQKGINETSDRLKNLSLIVSNATYDFKPLTPRLETFDTRHDQMMINMNRLSRTASNMIDQLNHTRWRIRDIRHMLHIATPGKNECMQLSRISINSSFDKGEGPGSIRDTGSYYVDIFSS